MSLYIRVSKITGIPIEKSTIKAVQVAILDQNSPSDFSYCRTISDPANKYQSILTSEEIWNFKIDPNSPPCSILVRLVDMEPYEMEIQRTILSSSWFGINSYVSDYFPLKPMVPSLGPSVALIDIHYIDPSHLPPNSIFKPFDCPKSDMLITPRWRSLKPFIPTDQPSNSLQENQSQSQNQEQKLSQELAQDNLEELIPEKEEKSKQENGSIGQRKRSNSFKNLLEFPNYGHAEKAIDPYYVAFEKYSFDLNTLQSKFNEFEKASKQSRVLMPHSKLSKDQRRASQSQVNNNGSHGQIEKQEKRRGSQSQFDAKSQKARSNRPIPSIVNKKQDLDNYKVID